MTIRDLPPSQNSTGEPVEIRLRAALKFLLRACKFRCVTLRPQNPEFADGDGI